MIGLFVFLFVVVSLTFSIWIGLARWAIWHFRPLIRARHDYYRYQRMKYDYPAYAAQVLKETQTQAKREKIIAFKARGRWQKRQAMEVAGIEETEATPQLSLAELIARHNKTGQW